MATVSYPAVSVTSTWADVVAVHAAVANAKSYIQNTGKNSVYVFFGGAAAPAGTVGTLLKPGEGFEATSDHVWVRGQDATSLLSIVTI